MLFTMNKTAMPQSPGSAASSETSETQSIGDEPVNYSSVRSTKKSNKESEKERPPWRPVSIAAPSKADKNALLKAKILDATRRALIFQKIANASTQTDSIQTKLMRDADVDVQIDLILQQDKSVETDGAITIRQENLGGFIMTQTVGQMTEGIMLSDIATQTAPPKTNLAFGRFLYKDVYTADASASAISIDDIINKNEKILRAQIAELKQLDTNYSQSSKKQKHALRNDMPIVSDDSLSPENSEGNASDAENDDKLIHESPNVKRTSNTRNFITEPTLTSWEDFDLTDDEDGDTYARPCLPRRTMSAAQAPWSDYREMLIGQRLANMRLSPLPPKRTTLKKKTVSWSDTQEQAVTELISEASALMDAFDEVSMLLGPNLQLNNVIEVTADVKALPESIWDPILTKSCQSLADELKKFKPHHFRTPYS